MYPNSVRPVAIATGTLQRLPARVRAAVEAERQNNPALSRMMVFEYQEHEGHHAVQGRILNTNGKTENLLFDDETANYLRFKPHEFVISVGGTDSAPILYVHYCTGSAVFETYLRDWLPTPIKPQHIASITLDYETRALHVFDGEGMRLAGCTADQQPEYGCLLAYTTGWDIAETEWATTFTRP